MKNYNKYYYWLYWNGVYGDYKDFYDFYKNSSENSQQKSQSFFTFYINRFKENKELECKLQLTFLKKFILTDSDDEEYTKMYQNMLWDVREKLIYKNIVF